MPAPEPRIEERGTVLGDHPQGAYRSTSAWSPDPPEAVVAWYREHHGEPEATDGDEVCWRRRERDGPIERVHTIRVKPNDPPAAGLTPEARTLIELSETSRNTEAPTGIAPPTTGGATIGGPRPPARGWRRWLRRR